MVLGRLSCHFIAVHWLPVNSSLSPGALSAIRTAFLMPAQQWRDVIAICNRDTYARVNNITSDGYSIVTYRSGSELKPRRHEVNNAIEAKFCTFALDVCAPIRDFVGLPSPRQLIESYRRHSPRYRGVVKREKDKPGIEMASFSVDRRREKRESRNKFHAAPARSADIILSKISLSEKTPSPLLRARATKRVIPKLFHRRK